MSLTDEDCAQPGHRGHTSSLTPLLALDDLNSIHIRLHQEPAYEIKATVVFFGGFRELSDAMLSLCDACIQSDSLKEGN
jgi:hypothetical protein